MKLKEKTILIISPQPWSNMFVSKHHYTIELMKRGNTVYFLQPDNLIPENTNKNYPNLHILNLKKFAGSFLRFHYRPLYKILLAKQIKKIISKINRSIDVLINFDNTGKFTDTTIFNAKKTAFFPVDQINKYHLKEYKNCGDIIFSISPLILDSFKQKPQQKILLNHGLGKDWEIKAKEKPAEPSQHQKVNVGYFGNLCFGKGLDMDTLRKVIELNQNTSFHFWGNYSLNNNAPEDIKDWIKFLKATNNVTLYGAVNPKELILQTDFIDVFLLCYDYRYETNKCSNSHKILEYLSTGKVTVANKMSMYADNKELMNMLPLYDNDEYLQLFKSTITNLVDYNSIELQIKRKEFSLENTYAKQIQKIENQLNLL